MSIFTAHTFSVLALIFHAQGFPWNFTAGTGIWPKIGLGNGIWTKFGLGNGIYTPPSGPSIDNDREKGKYTAVSTFSIKLWIYLFHVVVLQRYQNIKSTKHVLQVIVLQIRTYCSTLHSRCAHWTNYSGKFSRSFLRPLPIGSLCKLWEHRFSVPGLVASPPPLPPPWSQHLEHIPFWLRAIGPKGPPLLVIAIDNQYSKSAFFISLWYTLMLKQHFIELVYYLIFCLYMRQWLKFHLSRKARRYSIIAIFLIYFQDEIVGSILSTNAPHYFLVILK